ncbi:DUF2155 domain-containing protein [Henriciella sp. AS95]|uniref:DUF2155 domain-containing protein n=1 Tax=Henriciella sp. AS95 TaxID=3135782 RepID=UPI00316FAEF1
MRLTPFLAAALIAGAVAPPSSAVSYNEEQTATLRALDKITGRSTDFEIKVDEPVIYGSLKINLEVCYQTPPEEPPESAAFLHIETASATRMQSMTEPRPASDVEQDASTSKKDADAPETLFSGWMFASTPGLSALEHPVYDVWVIRCTDREPVSPSTPEAPEE